MLGGGEGSGGEVGGGWRLYSRMWQPKHLGQRSAAVLSTRVSGARQGGGEVRLYSSNSSAQAGTRAADGGRALRALAALSDPA